MIVSVRNGTPAERVDALAERIQRLGVTVTLATDPDGRVSLILSGDTASLDADMLAGFDSVARVVRLTPPYRLPSRKHHPSDTVIRAGSAVIGGAELCLIAGPCSVESEEQINSIARAVADAGASVLRGGAFKPRSSPMYFQGLHAEGLRMLTDAGKSVGLPTVSEITDISQLDFFCDTDILQVGARNMQNYELLRELGHIRKPIILKRGPGCTLNELLMSAEYIMIGGNREVILCERGIRTFEAETRYTFDIAALPLLRELSHLPVIADPSHSCGRAAAVPPLSLAAVAAGAQGLMIEVHCCPQEALSDGRQAITPECFAALAASAGKVRSAL